MAKYALYLGTLGLLFLQCVNRENSMSAQDSNANHLINESSPYLLQHAYNPVDWHPWGEKAIDKAKKEDKLLIISIGYAACHWCHVMEHESFEDSTVAAKMNNHFVSIKVDREERPDIDDVYMTACHLATGNNCGWPLNAFALPDGRPLWAGTYFPKDNWLKVLDYFIDLKEKDPEKLNEFADKLTEGVRTSELVPASESPAEFTPDVLSQFAGQFLSEMDMKKGGRKGAPKFPMPVNYHFMLQAGHLLGIEKAEEAVEVTLSNMAAGGIYDQLGGGFARYSVDDEWHVPHFEKMLYDNGQLTSLYSEAFQYTGDSTYLDIIKGTIDFIKRELSDGKGGYYSSLDADSEGEEGTYYVWTRDEVMSLIQDEKAAEIFCEYYDITGKGNWEEGKNVLRVVKTAGDLAGKHKMNISEIEQILETGRDKLFRARQNRERPGLDDKMLCSWNSLMLKGLIDAYKATGQMEYLDEAKKSAAFIKNNFLRDGHRLDRNYKNGKSTINAFLDDYALTIQAFIALYQVNFEEEWLREAEKLTDYTLEHFTDDSSNFFFYTSDLDPPLVARRKELADNVIPGSNSVMATNLYLLGHFLYKKDYLDLSEQLMKRMAAQIKEMGQPGFYGNWCSLYASMMNPLYEIAIVGEDYEALNHEMQRMYLPNAIFLGGRDEGDLELLKGKLQDGETYIYVCQNKVCKFPVTTVEEAVALME